MDVYLHVNRFAYFPVARRRNRTTETELRVRSLHARLARLVKATFIKTVFQNQSSAADGNAKTDHSSDRYILYVESGKQFYRLACIEIHLSRLDEARQGAKCPQRLSADVSGTFAPL